VKFKGLLLVLAGWVLLGSAGRVLWAQTLISDYYSVDDGLASRLVTDLLIDQRGFVWIAGESGLDRYDGYEFHHFNRTTAAREDGYLSQNKITDLALLEDGRIAIFYEGFYPSFDLIDPRSLVVETVEVSMHIAKGSSARSFYVSPQGQLYALAKGRSSTSLYVYEPQSGDFVLVTSVTEQWNASYAKIDFVALDDDRFLVYDEEHGLRLIQAGKVRSLDIPATLFQMSDQNGYGGPARFLYKSRGDEVFLSLGEVSGLLRVETDSNVVRRHTALPDSLEYGRIYEDERGNLLVNVSTFAGRYPSNEDWFCLQADGQVSKFSHLRRVGDFVIAVASRDFFRDILFGLDTGLKEVRNTATKVERILYKPLQPDERGYSMRGMVADGAGYLYFAREVRRWYRFHEASGQIDTLFLQDGQGGFLNFTNCQGILYDERGYLWGFTSDGTAKGKGMVHRYDLANCQTDTYEIPDFIQAYSGFDEGKIWLGVQREGQPGYLMSFDTLRKSFTPFTDNKGENPFMNVHIRYLLLSNYWPDVLWVGSEDGLFRVNTSTRRVDGFFAQSSAGEAVPGGGRLYDNPIYSLYEDEVGVLWIGTKNGLHRYNPHTEQWDVYTVSDGLTSNTVACILPDKHSPGLWISTYNGLSYFVPDEPDQLRRFSRIDGFAHSEFNRFSCIAGNTGRLYFGGVNGVSAFYPKDLLVRTEVPKPLLASFSYYDGRRDTLITQLEELDDGVYLTVEPYFDYFNFNFSLPIYTPTTENQFRYRIGNDPQQEWIYLKDSRSLSYSNMKKGSYTFYVQGADPNGNWSEETLLIHLRVKESFWRSPAFGFILVTLLGLIALGIYTDRVNQKLKMERLRTQLASNLHDEVSGLLAGISLQSEILRDQTEDQLLEGKLKTIWEASQGAMSKMSDVIWSIDTRRDRVAELITRIEEHADDVLLPLGIRYRIKTYELDVEKPMPATIRQDLYFIAKEAINNVAKHAKTEWVDIRLGHEGKYFELLIKDNGRAAHQPQRSPAGRRQRRGQGLGNLHLRANRLKAELKILRGRGYTIHLRMKKFL
jgi:two-component sensor histidine kinase/streptogramin lyase